jgi:hypothetical protein
MISVPMKLSSRKSLEKILKVQNNNHKAILPLLRNIRTYKLSMTKIPLAIQLPPALIKTKINHLNLEIRKAL